MSILRNLHQMNSFYIMVLSIVFANVCLSLSVAAEPSHEIISIADVEWQPLNPARGDKSPKAGTLWGDRNGSVATGFLVKFTDGFSSPPHIHNVAYRGVVISGQIHNDDPNAEKMWMPAGSFWTQPAGEIHITAAKGDNNVAYIEIDSGPYLVRPTEKKFDNGERPVNVDKSNLVWLEQPGRSVKTNSLMLSYLWGKPHGKNVYGALIKLPPGITTSMSSHGSFLNAVVIQGQPNYHVSKEKLKTLQPGSFFSSKQNAVHTISSKEEVVMYVRTNGKLDFPHK